MGGPRHATLAVAFSEEVAIHGFEGHEDGQISSPYLTEQYQAAAVHFSALMPRRPTGPATRRNSKKRMTKTGSPTARGTAFSISAVGRTVGR